MITLTVQKNLYIVIEKSKENLYIVLDSLRQCQPLKSLGITTLNFGI